MKAILFVCVSLMALATAPFLGITGVPWMHLFDSSSPDYLSFQQIFLSIRLPRVALAALAGAALSSGGLVFQGVFRNSLACPYTLGVSTGAAFGAVTAIHFGAGGGPLGLSLWAFVGALLTISLVCVLGYRQSSAGMLLAGVVVSLFFSSLVVLMQYLSDYEGLMRIVRWLMGGLETVGWQAVLNALVFVVPGVTTVFIFARELDLLALGDELAAGWGVEVTRARKFLFLGTSLMVGGVVAVCGPIGFVGIMVPHFCRLLFGYSHRGLAVWSALGGAAFLALCDGVGRLLIPPFEVPVGVITALLGGPFFLWVLLRSRPA